MEQNIELQFSLNSDNFQLLENDDYCGIAQIDFLHVGLNRNKCNISEDCVKKSLQTFYNKPLLCILDNSFIPSLANDFKEHAYSEDERKKFIAFGTIPESTNFDFVERNNGKTYLTSKVVIWKSYFPIIMNILKRRDGNVKVSIELKVIDGKQDEETGVLDIYEFQLLSCVLLGENIMEGIEGSHLEVLRFSLNEDDFKKANEYYLSFSQKQSQYEIPSDIKDIVQEQLNSYKTDGKGLTNQDLELAKILISNKYIDKAQIDKINKKIFNTKTSVGVFNILGGDKTKNWLQDIDNGKIGGVLMQSLSTGEISDRIWKALEPYKYMDGDYEARKYYIEEIYVDEKVIILRDNETAGFYKVPYTMDNNKINIDMDSRKEVHKTYEETETDYQVNNAMVFAKKDYGTGETIEVDKSKEAMSETSWGLVNKTELRKKVLEAKNYKSLVKDVYALVEEGWEEAPSSKLKYPIMEIKEGKAVYNRYGLASALAYAEKNNEETVIAKVKSLYKKLDIDNNDEGGEKKMAKELEEEKVVENKLDEKDVEEKDKEVEGQEEKNSAPDEEVKHQSEVDTGDIKKNSDEKEDEKPEEDEEDRDYWKEKANALEIKNAEIEAELKKYKREEEERNMSAEVDKFAHCMTEEEAVELKNSIKDLSMFDLKEKINTKIAEFALKIKENKEKEENYSVNPLFEFNTMKFSEKEINSLDDIINNSSATIAGKK